MTSRRIIEQPTSVAQRLREVTDCEAAARGKRFELVAQLRNEHGWNWQQIGAELGITKPGSTQGLCRARGREPPPQHGGRPGAVRDRASLRDAFDTAPARQRTQG
jgi:hypothetical protein